MGHMKVAEARARFGEILDEAEKGTPVFIERRGVTFRIVAEPVAGPAARRDSLFEFVHDDVERAQWTWTSGGKGLAFAARRKRR